MKKNRFFLIVFLPVMILAFTSSCKKEISNSIPESEAVESSDAVASGRHTDTELLRSLRAATSRFNSTAQAIRAGYEPDDHCVSVPGVGGMGYHWVNPSMIDPVFDPMKPEAVLYAKGPGGNLRLVAVEYLVLNTGQPRPMFDSHPFDIGGAPIPVAHWTLHVWVHEHNPDGVFAKFNPNITCP